MTETEVMNAYNISSYVMTAIIFVGIFIIALLIGSKHRNDDDY